MHGVTMKFLLTVFHLQHLPSAKILNVTNKETGEMYLSNTLSTC